MDSYGPRNRVLVRGLDKSVGSSSFAHTVDILNFIHKGKKLYFGFVDLEKAFDRVPREVISWAMRKLGVEEWLVSAVMSTYTGAKTVVR